MSRPSKLAADAAVVECSRLLQNQIDGSDAANEALDAAHDPALGLDRSVCLRDVVEALRGIIFGEDAANFLEREFTNKKEHHA